MNSLNSTTPLISVVIPVYNAEAYLERCVRCLQKQTYRNLEFILVDDGSTDSSGALCDNIATEDARFKIFHIANGGASLARKFGLEHATGEYVSFVDSDDCIADCYIEQLFKLAQTYNTAISACGVKRIFNESEIPDDTSGSSTLLGFDEMMRRFFKYEFWGFCAKLYKRDILLNAEFPQATLSEDYFVMFQLFMRERQMSYTDAPLYYYEYHEGSLSHLKLSKRAFEEFGNVKAVYDLALDQAPQYADMAMSNVVETCIKLLGMTRRDRSKSFEQEARPLRQFLHKHFWKILRNKAIFWKLKVVAAKVLICK